jgi:hypothetical protein
MKTYSEQEVIKMLTQERERTIKIVDDFWNKHLVKFNSYLDEDKHPKYIAKCELEVCRKIGNTIDGRLLLSIDELLEEQIKSEYINTSCKVCDDTKRYQSKTYVMGDGWFRLNQCTNCK